MKPSSIHHNHTATMNLHKVEEEKFITTVMYSVSEVILFSVGFGFFPNFFHFAIENDEMLFMFNATIRGCSSLVYSNIFL